MILEQCTVIGMDDTIIQLARTEQDEKGSGIAAIQHGLSEDYPPAWTRAITVSAPRREANSGGLEVN